MAGSDFLNLRKLPFVKGLLYLAEGQAIIFLISSVIAFSVSFKYINRAVSTFGVGSQAAVWVAIVIVVYCTSRYLASGGKCAYRSDLSGKIVVITGANSGLGFSAAVKLAKMNATIVMGCRSMSKAEEAIQDLKSQVKGYDAISAIELDLASLASVREFARVFRERFPHVDVLICNAGIAWVDFSRTKDGFESHFQSNHLGHFLLVNLLFDYLEKAQGRVVSVSSLAHALVPQGVQYDVINNPRTYDQQKGYGTSKLANILFTKALQCRMKTARAYVVHPGLVLTPIDKRVPFSVVKMLFPVIRVVMKSADEGSESIVYCAIHPSAPAGAYICDCRVTGTTPIAENKEATEELWKLSEELVQHKFQYGGKAE